MAGIPSLLGYSGFSLGVGWGRQSVGGPGTKAWLSSPVEVYTIQGNSHGKPCTIPFKYDNQWFHGCTSTGREDGHLWCATTQDYGKDERWGFCPIKSEKESGGEPWRAAGDEGRGAGVGGPTDSERAEELSGPEVPLPWCSLCGS